MRELFLSVVTRDTEAMVRALTELGFIGKGAHTAALEQGLSLLLEQYYGMTLGEVRELDIPQWSIEIEQLLYDQPFQIPAQFTFIARAISTLVGVSTGLAPDFNFIEVADALCTQVHGHRYRGHRTGLPGSSCASSSRP